MVDNLMVDSEPTSGGKIDVVVDSPVGPLQVLPESDDEASFLRDVTNNNHSLDNNTKLILALDSIQKALAMASPDEVLMDLLPSELDDMLLELIEKL